MIYKQLHIIVHNFRPIFTSPGKKFLNIIDYSNALEPKLDYKKAIKDEVNAIGVCGSKVAFLIDGNPGRLDIYNAYNSTTKTFELNTTIADGKKQDVRDFAIYPLYVMAT